jgi:hypothetical protein
MALPARSTRFLTEARVEVAPASRRTMATAFAGIVIVLAAALGFANYLGAAVPFSRVGALEVENASLKSEVSRLRVELDIERATRAALDQQVAELNGQVGELSSQVEFYRAKGAPKRAMAPRD